MARSIHGTKPAGHGMYIHAVSIGAFPQKSNEAETWFSTVYSAADEARVVLLRLAKNHAEALT